MRHNYKGLLAAALLIGPGLAAAQGDDAVAEYDALLKEITGLEVYNELLERQIQAQQQDIVDLQTAIEGVPDLERQLPPVLIEMVRGLEEFVRLDIPFRTAERDERVAQLQLLVERSDVNDAEKLRRILEAWLIETEYGYGYTTYIGELEIDGSPREVDFLQVGRVALLYQTTDENPITGAWDNNNGAWITLGTEHRNSVRRALQMARNQIAPELVLLPVFPPE